MNTIEIEKRTKVFKELGHPIRLKIVNVLAMQGCCNEAFLSERLELTQSNISFHLESLKTTGIVTVIRKENESYYEISSDVEDCVYFLIKCFPRYGLNEVN